MTAAHRKTQAVTEVEVGPVGRSRSLRMILIIRLTHFRMSPEDMGKLLKTFQIQGVMAVFAV